MKGPGGSFVAAKFCVLPDEALTCHGSRPNGIRPLKDAATLSLSLALSLALSHSPRRFCSCESNVVAAAQVHVGGLRVRVRFAAIHTHALGSDE